MPQLPPLKLHYAPSNETEEAPAQTVSAEGDFPEITSPAPEGIVKHGSETGNPPPPFISFVTFNRLGITVRNLKNLLDSEEEFELHIIDCNSKDNSWDFIQSLRDSRIKSKIRFECNCGPIFVRNFALTQRKPDQYFITMDSDTFIKTKNWISRFMEVFEAFPDVGLLGLMRDKPYPRFLPPIIPRVSGNVSYLELKDAEISREMDFVPGHLQCLNPKLIETIGYWSEENGFGDAEISPRIVHYTPFKVGFITTIEIDMTQKITCNECLGREYCKLSRSVNDCFSLSRKLNKNDSFVDKYGWKYIQTFQELQEGKRTAYCASIHDPESIKNHLYHADWAYENFNHYIEHAN
jgi:glycosyltransferase involved in cell wall biosynthesis